MLENPTTDIVMTRKAGNSICPFVVFLFLLTLNIFVTESFFQNKYAYFGSFREHSLDLLAMRSGVLALSMAGQASAILGCYCISESSRFLTREDLHTGNSLVH